ncbi:DUF4879 domain-containing protein [Pseudobacillus badius]|uniref:DUF4879 domain-containing protein n=1 Tax=Bacillus badius TaxID=1455 RepID=UPI0024A0BF53|nr:DUF4879 domain-containing protein [Bacillus badius]GLY12195.1 hypothetical protein Bbad01_34110 [Bacillus badius]
MKKLFSVLAMLALTISTVFWVTSSESSAGPAPRLTDVQIVGITSDGNDFVMEKLTRDQRLAEKPLKGETVRIAIYEKGTVRKGFLRIKNGEEDITHKTKALHELTDYLVDKDRIVYGYIKYYDIPVSLVNSGTIEITGLDYASNNTYSDYIHFKIEN